MTLCSLFRNDDFLMGPRNEGGTLIKKPTLRVTKWLGDIPVEASYSACVVVFKGKGSGHQPNREEYRSRFKRSSTNTAKQRSRRTEE
jgi:hypothetical protein